MNKVLIKLKKINKIYNEGKKNEFHALKDIDFEIKESDFVSIMGPSGSGKSTLMNIIGLLDIATTGEFTFHNTSVKDFSNEQIAKFRNKEIGFVFQQFNLLPRFSVRENVLLPGIYGEYSLALSNLESSLKKVGLLDKIDSKPNELSGGQIQRVAIARALIMNPSVLLADEPTGNLDSTTARDITNIFQKLNDEGKTVVMITHSNEIAKMTKTRIELLDGRIKS